MPSLNSLAEIVEIIVHIVRNCVSCRNRLLEAVIQSEVKVELLKIQLVAVRSAYDIHNAEVNVMESGTIM
jgi:hypothetical protein